MAAAVKKSNLEVSEQRGHPFQNPAGDVRSPEPSCASSSPGGSPIEPSKQNISAPTEPSLRQTSSSKKKKRASSRPPKTPRVKVDKLEDGGYWLDLSKQEIERLKAALGIEDDDFLLGILTQMVEATNGTANEAGLNFMVSIVKGAKCKNQNQALLSVQMAMMHNELMYYGKMLKGSSNLDQVNSLGNVVTKLARAIGTHIEILHRCQTTNEQSVTVQNVSVSDGGKAIVGNVTHNARETRPEMTKGPAAIVDASGTAMEIIDPKSDQVEVPAKHERDDE